MVCQHSYTNKWWRRNSWPGECYSSIAVFMIACLPVIFAGKYFFRESNPKKGPRKSIIKLNCFQLSETTFKIWILTIVIAKPIEVTIVKAVPLFAAGADCATRVENCGESETTVNPQINKTNKKNPGEKLKIAGDNKQQTPEIIKE